jgi:hypothetical protein
MHGVTISVAFYIIPHEIIVQNKDNNLVPYMHIQTIVHYCLFICNIHSRSSGLLRSAVTNIIVLQLNIKQEEVLRVIDLQQNSFNLQSGNSENLIIQYKRRAVPRLQVLLFTRKKKSLIIETGIFQGHVQKVLQECLYIKCDISWHLVSYSSTSAVKTPENTEGPDDPEIAAQGNTQIEYSSDESYSPKYRRRNKKLHFYAHIVLIWSWPKWGSCSSMDSF